MLSVLEELGGGPEFTEGAVLSCLMIFYSPVADPAATVPEFVTMDAPKSWMHKWRGVVCQPDAISLVVSGAGS